MSINILLDKAAVHGLRNEFVESAVLYSEVLDIDPRNAVAANELGHAHHRGIGVPQNLERAEELFEVAHQGGSKKALCNLGVLHQERGETREAMRLFFNLAVVHEEHGETKKAIELFEKSRRLGKESGDGGNPKASLNLGFLHHQRGETEKAMMFFDEAYRGGHPDGASNLIVMYEASGNIPEAIKLSEELRRRGDTIAAYELGSLYLGLGEAHVGLAIARLKEAQRAGVTQAAAFLQKLQEEFPPIHVGDHVCIHGDDIDPQLNGLQGTVVKRFATSGSTQGRFGIWVDNLGLVFFCWHNLRPVVGSQPRDNTIEETLELYRQGGSAIAAYDLGLLYLEGGEAKVGLERLEEASRAGIAEAADLLEFWKEEFPIDVEDFSIQGASGEVSALTAHDAGAINAQISEALVRARACCAFAGKWVVKIQFSRDPASLGKALLEAPELAECRCALESQGLAVELESGAKVFVRPEHYKPLIQAVKMQRAPLYPKHVLVDPDLEAAVMRAVGELPGTEKVHPKRKSEVPLGFAGAAVRSGEKIETSRTFISIWVPSSLRSASDSDAPRTRSTTDADPRKGANHRAGRGGTVSTSEGHHAAQSGIDGI